MSGATTDIGNNLQEARAKLRNLQAAMRKARVVRVVGTLVGLAIAVIYAILFVVVITRGFERERLMAAIEKKVQDRDFRSNLDRLRSRIQNEVWPVYRDELLKKAEQMDIAAAVAPQALRLAGEVLPDVMQKAAAKAAELNLVESVTTELQNLVVEVGPRYMQAASEAVSEVDLMTDLTTAAKEVGADVGQAYQAELNRIAPDVLKAAQTEYNALGQELGAVLERQVGDSVRQSLTRNEAYVRDQTGLTEEQVEAKLADIVVSAEQAVKGVVKQRTDRYQKDLSEINDVLARIPDSKLEDPQQLLDQIGEVSINLLKLALPESQSKLEWK